MKIEERKKLKDRIPEVYIKSWVIGSIGGIIGGSIGGYFSVSKGNFLYGGIGVGIGIIVGEVIGILINRKMPLQQLLNTEKRIKVFCGALSLLLAVAGIIGFLLTGRWIGIVGAVFFVLSGIYLLKM